MLTGFLGVPGPFNEAEIRRSVTVDLLKRIDIPLVPDRWEETAAVGVTKGLLKIAAYRHLFSFVGRGGWFSASRFVGWMTAKLNLAADGRRTGYGDMTLSECYKATGRELCLIASDTTARRMLVVNHRTAPECPLVCAVRMSMSIPLVCAEVEWQEDWGLYREQDMVGHASSASTLRRGSVSVPHAVSR